MSKSSLSAANIEPLQQELLTAVELGKYSRIKPLREKGVSLDAPLLDTGDTALNICAGNGFRQSSIELLQGGANAYIPNNDGVIPAVKALKTSRHSLAREIVMRSLPIPEEWGAAICDATQTNLESTRSEEARRDLQFILNLLPR